MAAPKDASSGMVPRRTTLRSQGGGRSRRGERGPKDRVPTSVVFRRRSRLFWRRRAKTQNDSNAVEKRPGHKTPAGIREARGERANAGAEATAAWGDGAGEVQGGRDPRRGADALAPPPGCGGGEPISVSFNTLDRIGVLE